MQKRNYLIVLIGLLVVVSAGLMLWSQLGAVSMTGLRIVQAEPLTKRTEADFISAEVQVGSDLHTVTGSMHMSLTNRTGVQQDELVLRLYANAVQEGSLTLSDLTMDGIAVQGKADAEDPSVLHIARSWAPGETLQAACAFVLTLPQESGYIGVQDDLLLAVGALPLPAPWVNDAWSTPTWDALSEPSFAQAFDLTLSVCVPRGVRAVAGGTLTGVTQDADGSCTLNVQMQGARDIAFAASRSGTLYQRTAADGTLVTVLGRRADAAKRLADAAVQGLDALGALGFSAGSGGLSFVQADTGYADGLIGSGLAVLAADTQGEEFLQRVTRLCARQVFGVLVENDPYNAPWLSISLASTAELLTYRQRRGEGAYQARFDEQIEVALRLTRPYGVTVGADAAHFGGDIEMTQVLRDQGAAMLLGIEQAMGRESFREALLYYVRAHAGGIGSEDALLLALHTVSGSQWDGYLSDMLSL